MQKNINSIFNGQAEDAAKDLKMQLNVAHWLLMVSDEIGC